MTIKNSCDIVDILEAKGVAYEGKRVKISDIKSMQILYALFLIVLKEKEVGVK